MEAIKLVGDARGLGTSVKVSFSVQLRRFVRVWSCLSEVAWGRGGGGRGSLSRSCGALYICLVVGGEGGRAELHVTDCCRNLCCQSPGMYRTVEYLPGTEKYLYSVRARIRFGYCVYETITGTRYMI